VASNAFDQLSLGDQKCAIDISIAALIIGTRLGADKALYDYVLAEFARSQTIPANLAKYALRSLGENLFKQDWSFTVTKKGSELAAQFHPAPLNEKAAQEIP